MARPAKEQVQAGQASYTKTLLAIYDILVRKLTVGRLDIYHKPVKTAR
jgi:hypothetical protein